ncbi:MAG TPA: YceI family protein [Candidatus Sulfotelmatobacter sp.]|nr:YceI family protein [Candidatus Sulfotelmatobacter sp.]
MSATQRLANKWLVIFAVLAVAAISAAAQQADLALDPAHTSVKFTLGDVLHTVHGTFQLKQGALQLDPATGRVSGEIVVDARSGESGSGMRDRKMHKEVLESANYPDISFRPDRVEGVVTIPGKGPVKVHGMFRIHGVDREITVPAEVEMSADHWSATVHFTIPYAKWGMKNPSTLFLRVNDSVEIDLIAAGNVVQHSAATRNSAQ